MQFFDAVDSESHPWTLHSLMDFRLTALRNFDTVILLGQPQPEQEHKMATSRGNGEGTIWYAKTEARIRAQYPDSKGHT
jgi:hypothetical protein